MVFQLILLSPCRAGAFQFIDANTSEECLPLPYQIQILTRDGGTICWRYPQPRSLNYVKIFPVPFHVSCARIIFNNYTTHVAPILQASTVADKIHCEMEYYSDAHREFLSYCDFYLSEKEIVELKLPLRKVTAEIWRIRVRQPYILVDSNFFQEESSSEDEDDNGASPTRSLSKTLKIMGGHLNVTAIEDYLNEDSTTTTGVLNIHPRALVGCMRIDSNFNTKLIPSVQAVFKIVTFTLALRNVEQQHSAAETMPEPLKSYKIADDFTNVQTFIKFTLDNVRAHGNFFQDSSVSLHTEMRCSSSIIDYGYLTMQPLLDECNVQMYGEYGAKLMVNVVIDDIRLRYGPLVGHSLSIAKQIWWRHFAGKQATQTDKDTVITSRFVICNATATIIEFSQYDGDSMFESIYLQPKECSFYAFRTGQHEQRLAFVDVDNGIPPSKDLMCIVAVGVDRTEVVRWKDDRLMVIRTEKLSATQKKITVKGQIEVISMTQQPLRMLYKANDSGDNVHKPMEFEVKKCGSMSLFTQCNDEMTQFIK